MRIPESRPSPTRSTSRSWRSTETAKRGERRARSPAVGTTQGARGDGRVDPQGADRFIAAAREPLLARHDGFEHALDGILAVRERRTVSAPQARTCLRTGNGRASTTSASCFRTTATGEPAWTHSAAAPRTRICPGSANGSCSSGRPPAFWSSASGQFAFITGIERLDRGLVALLFNEAAETGRRLVQKRAIHIKGEWR
jgi:hypothetical protein